jgi:hypothetical protein
MIMLVIMTDDAISVPACQVESGAGPSSQCLLAAATPPTHKHIHGFQLLACAAAGLVLCG